MLELGRCSRPGGSRLGNAHVLFAGSPRAADRAHGPPGSGCGSGIARGVVERNFRDDSRRAGDARHLPMQGPGRRAAAERRAHVQAMAGAS